MLFLIGNAFGFKMTIKPFSISCETWKTGVGVILFGIGLHLLGSDIRTKERKETIKAVNELINDFINSKKSENK